MGIEPTVDLVSPPPDLKSEDSTRPPTTPAYDIKVLPDFHCSIFFFVLQECLGCLPGAGTPPPAEDNSHLTGALPKNPGAFLLAKCVMVGLLA
jgi:hypothetical protein